MTKFYISIFCLLFANKTMAQIDPKTIDIARDRWGVPHIFAKTDAQVSYGLAYAHAEDDFKTIQELALSAKAMLGQHYGKNGAIIDFVVQLIRAKEQVDAHYDQDVSAAYKAVMEGYCQGINDYAAKHPHEVLVKGLFPVTAKEMTRGFVLSNASFGGIDRALKAILGGKVPTPTQLSGSGSNAFAFNSSKTKDGKTYLNINSHQPLEGPVAWYEAHLCSEEGLNILGGLFPGAPTVLHGCNENLGWAHTVNYHDKMDIFQLEINPKNKLQYKMDGQWKTLEERKIKLSIKGLPFNITKKIYWSDYGPTLIADKGTYSLRFAGLFDIRAGEQWYKMNKAKNFNEFYEALKMTAITGFNIVYADRFDTIFYVSNGKIPLRNKQYNWQNTLPGDTSATVWQGFHLLQDLPQLLNPKAGYVFNTNNTPFNATAPNENLKNENFDATMGIETFELNRSQRFMELIAQYDKVSFEDFKTIKYDRQLPKKFSYLTDVNPFFDLDPTLYPDIASQIAQLKHWNHRSDLDNSDVSVFIVSYIYLKDKFAKTGENPYRKLREDECVAALRHTKAYLNKHFGTTIVPLGTLQFHVRGNVALPVVGMPDVLAAIDTKPYKDGKIRASNGESYIELVKFEKGKLPEIESVNAYGASNHADSPHYTDQMELYINQKTKKMTLDKATVLKEATRIYHPGE